MTSSDALGLELPTLKSHPPSLPRCGRADVRAGTKSPRVGPSPTLEEMLEHYKQFVKRMAVQNLAAPRPTTQPGVSPPVIDRPFTDAETGRGRAG